MSGAMADTETLRVIKQEIHKQAKDEGGFMAVRGDLMMTMIQN
jgi:hypothetical protein